MICGWRRKISIILRVSSTTLKDVFSSEWRDSVTLLFLCDMLCPSVSFGLSWIIQTTLMVTVVQARKYTMETIFYFHPHLWAEWILRVGQIFNLHLGVILWHCCNESLHPPKKEEDNSNNKNLSKRNNLGLALELLLIIILIGIGIPRSEI